MRVSEVARSLLARLRALMPREGRDRAGLFVTAALIASGLVLILFLGPGSMLGRQGFEDVAPGGMATRDISADREFTWVDDIATGLRIEAEQRLVLPVFVIDDDVGAASLGRLAAFRELLLPLAEQGTAPDTLYLKVQSELPGLLAREDVLALARSPFRAQAFAEAEPVLRRVLERGIASRPSSGLESYNADYVELHRRRDGRLVVEELPSSRLPTLRDSGDAIDEEIATRHLARPLPAFVVSLVRSFLVENAFFDAGQSARRLESVARRVQPVVRTVAKGERILRKGFVVTETDAARLAAARGDLGRADWRRIVGDAGYYLAVVALAFLLLGQGVSGMVLGTVERILAAAALFVYLGLSLLAARVAPETGTFFIPLVMPVACLAMLLSVLAGMRFALLFGFVAALLSLPALDFDAHSFAFLVFAAGAGAFTARSARSRIDLVRAGAVLALWEALAAAVLSAAGTGAETQWFGGIFWPTAWAALNGFLSGILCLGFLPLLEQALNVPTRFRLMELSDLNAPMLKRLLTVAPGTYAHSVQVAHLAESASREIGADPLLARVGAYYHDIGKIEQPEYFVENQAGYNKHDDLNPRLSATVLRSHVKMGVEKARALRLPDAVVDIVAEHHGNQIIAWFWDRASREDPTAKPEDFSYPGEPPRGRESAIVMLADAVEATARTLKRPTMGKLEECIGDLVRDRMEKGQLDRSGLTFRDLGLVRDSFTRILAGHYHSRIEYPKTREPSR